MKRTILYAVLAAAMATPLCARPSQYVYLVHGYGSMTLAMWSMERYLQRDGFDVTNWGYASLHTDLRQAGRELLMHVRSRNDIDTINFVTHSMGGLVVRSMLGEAMRDSTFPPLGRIVMLSPPNQGTWWSDVFGQSNILKWILGPNLGHMQTDTSALVHTLPLPPPGSVGIIAGARFDEQGYNRFITGDNDGFMTPDQMRLGIGEEFIVIPELHFFMPQNRKSKAYTRHFLRTGAFPRPPSHD